MSVPYHDVLVKSDERARENVATVDKFAGKPVVGQEGVAAQAARDAHGGGVRIAADNDGGQPLE